jgi:4-aminobutyrate aminotransferase-like enzyme
VLPEINGPVPGARSRELAAELRRYESRNVTYVAHDFPIFWARASGANVWDADGNRFLDFTSAFGVAGLGHTNAAVVEAARHQAEQLLHAMGDVHPSDPKVALCRKLSAMTFERWGRGAGRTILGNSGFEAVEAALKTSMLHSGRPGVIAFTGAYHGLGYGALATGGLGSFREPFRRQLKEFATLLPYPACYRCPWGVTEEFRLHGGPFPNCSSACLAQLEEKLIRAIREREIGSILVEPIQGRGGIIVPPRDFLPLLRRICDEEKILLIADEIYTGLNRTGALFACDHSNVVPDIVCLGKALTSGFPLSACVGRADVMDAWPVSQGEALHTSTFLGNPVGCAMALASLDQHERTDTPRQVRERGRTLRAALGALRSPFIGNVRGAGLLMGAELVDAHGKPNGKLAGALIKQCLRDGVILLADGPESNVIAFVPPFEIADEEIAFAVARVQENLTSLPGSIS